MKRLQNKAQKGIKIVLVEGPADRNLYERIYPDFEVKSWGSCDRIIETIEEFNRTVGKNSSVVGIVDRDAKTDEEIKALSEENIFVLGEREIEFIFLREDVIQKLFGEQIFQKFIIEICNNASERTSTQITDYHQALKVLKKEVSSKFNIRILFKIAGIQNRGNAKNIDLLCNMMDKKEAWDLVKDIFPDIYGNCIDSKIETPQAEKFYEQLQNFESNPDFPNIVIEKTENQQGEKEIGDI